MEEYFSLLCPLFAGIAQEDLAPMLRCLGGREKAVPKGSPVFLEGEPATHMGVVLTGTVQVVQQDYYGNRNVLSVLQPGDTFGEVFACAGLDSLPVSVLAASDCRVLLLDCRRVMTLCPHTCGFHNRLVQNLLQLISRKNLEFTRKIRIMSQKTTREKLLAYLLSQAKAQGASQFTIPLDRQSLADYLGVERSAMSAEISKLKKAGVLDTKGSWFSLNQSTP